MATAAQQADLIERIEALRFPLPPQPASDDWKDWYHFVLLHAATGWRAIVNVNLAGGGASAELQYTLVIHVPGAPPRLHGVSRSLPWRVGMVLPRPLSIRSDEVELVFDQQVFGLRVQPRGLDLGIALHARPDATPLLVTEGSAFGSGFIGWGVVPRLLVGGEVWACGQKAALTHDWFCYQDHNFGRFRWGEDFGWEWMVAHVEAPEQPAITVVVDLRSDRTHRRGGLPYLFVLVGRELRKVFLGPSMTMRWAWSDGARLPPRLPGAMATLLGSQTEREPVAVQIEAADERDRLSLRLEVDAHLQIVAADNRGGGHSRIGEVSGAVTIALRLGESSVEARGLAYAEFTR
ncbi:MAG: hypothetical protein QM722_03095 [Piscinibacter sp.]